MEKEYAGFWVRFGALVIDMVIMMILFYTPLSLIYGEEYWYSDKMILGFWDFLLGYVIPIVLTIVLWLKFQGTPGKMAMKLSIVDARTGKTISFNQAVIRYFAYILSMLPLFLGFIWVGFDKKKQGWHDKIADTVVIKTNEKTVVTFD